MKDARTIGERDRSHQRWTQEMHRLTGGPRLIVDNTCPVAPIRRPIRGIRIINGEDGGPDAA